MYKANWKGPRGLNASGAQLSKVNFVNGDLKRSETLQLSDPILEASLVIERLEFCSIYICNLYLWEVMDMQDLDSLIRKELPPSAVKSSGLVGFGMYGPPSPTPPIARHKR
jgi:hypothetical protein